jgi:hypothetical protein
MLGAPGVAGSDTMPAKILRFVSRSEQLRLRGMRNFTHWNRVKFGLEPFGPAERHRLFLRQAEDEAKDRAWAQRHHPLAEAAVVLPFTVRPESRRPRLQHDFVSNGLT